MRANSAPQSVADYCNALNSDKIIVNDEYQRGDNIWNSIARSYFIESILLEYPIPKIYLYSKVDLATRQSIKEIVDGQQRSRALQAFFNNKLRLSNKLESAELRGKRYRDLDEQQQSRFLSYSLPIDEFQGVIEDEVQESFRRMNASNVPLNAEEQRNAKYQGEFKWFNISLAADYRAAFTAIGLFSKRDIVRMQDLKAYAEISCVLDAGFMTLKGAQVDALYKRYDKEFSEASPIKTALPTGLRSFLNDHSLHRPPILRSHVFQSVVLALIARQFDLDLVARATDIAPEQAEAANRIGANFEDLVSALEDIEGAGALVGFANSNQQKTNVASSRATSFLYFYRSFEA